MVTRAIVSVAGLIRGDCEQIVSKSCTDMRLKRVVSVRRSLRVGVWSWWMMESIGMLVIVLIMCVVGFMDVACIHSWPLLSVLEKISPVALHV